MKYAKHLTITKKQQIKTLLDIVQDATQLHRQDVHGAILWAIDTIEDIYNNEPQDIQEAISDQADSATLIYNDEIMDWAARNYGLVDEYIQEFGIDNVKDGIVKLCQGAIYMSNERLLTALHEYITSQITHE